MPRRYAALFLLLALSAPVVAHADAPNNDCQPANPVVKWCPPNPNDSTLVPVYFNPDLDANLEAVGNAGTRTAAFAQAVADWNSALAGVGAKVRLVLSVDNNRWAVDQAINRCVDQFDPNALVFDVTPGPHIPNNESAASTGHNHNGTHVDLNNNPIGPGWIIPFGQQLSDTTGGFAVDAVLGICASQIDAQNPGCLTEGDIFWLTHYKMFGVDPCLRIRWDYDYPTAMPAATRYDFYSVMLHELGHFLGLAHQDADPTGKNVMQAFIGKGVRRQIGAKEKACLCALYGNNACTATSTRTSTWGRVKTLYR